MKLKFPAIIINKIINSINTDIDFTNTSEPIKQKVLLKAISLWLFIYEKQLEDEKKDIRLFTNISKGKLDTKSFRLYHNGTSYHFNKFIDILSSADLLEVNDSFSTGNFTKSYRTLWDFNSVEVKIIEIDFSIIFEDTTPKKDWLKRYPNQAHLINDTYRTKIDINNYINWLYKNEGKELKEKLNSIGIVEKNYLTTDKIIKYINAAVKFNSGNIWFKLSNEGRFYSSITNISHTAIPFLLLDKRKLESVDVSNNQPLLLNLLINNEGYKKDTEEGIFYNKIMQEFGITKNVCKLWIYRLFFGERQIKSGKFYEYFNANYPGFVDSLNKLKDKISIANELQKIESDIIVNSIGNLDFPKLLRHDQVLCHKEYYEDTIKTLVNIYKKKGLKVKLKDKEDKVIEI